MKKILSITFICLLAGCYRTEYYNVRPAVGADTIPVETQTVEASSRIGGWQHFFLWGLAPDERVMNASEACGTAESVGVIKTRQTFAEGLVAAVAGFYVNIYSPWDGAVYCKVQKS